jgi:hypothetical protein
MPSSAKPGGIRKSVMTTAGGSRRTWLTSSAPWRAWPAWQQPGQHGAVRPGRPCPPGLAAQYGDLVAQHQQFSRPGGIASGVKREPAEHPDHEQVKQSDSHERDHAAAR